MKLKKHILFALIVIQLLNYTAAIQAQEVHYSQPNANALAFNPANTGLFDGNIRVSAASRIQWLTLNNPFTSFYISADKAVLTNRSFGVGLQINQTKAGVASLAHTSIAFSTSYIKPLSRRNATFFSFGMNLGLDRWAFDSNNATFDSQYNGTIFDVTNASNEQPFNYSSKFFLNIGAGAVFFHGTDVDKYFVFSIAIDHLNSYRYQLLEINADRLAPRINALCTMSINLDKNHTYSLLPNISFVTQGGHRQSVVGAAFRYVPMAQQKDINAYVFALRTRLTPNSNIRPRSRITTNVEKLMFPESVILEARYEKQQRFSIGMAYDTNVSDLVVSTKSIGAIELSLMRIFGSAKSQKGIIKCPGL